MIRKLIFVLWLLLLPACARSGGTPTPTGSATTPIAADATPSRQTTGAMARPNTPTPSATPRPTMTPTPTATPIPAAITAGDQVLTETGEITIARVSLPADGWLALHAPAADGSTDEVLAFTAVPAGTHTDVSLTLDPLNAPPTLIAMLHVDAGELGAFESPGPDAPWRIGDGVVVAEISIEIAFERPALAVADQAVGEDGIVRVASVYAAEPGWLAIHADAAGEPGDLLGHVYLPAGLHEEVPVPIPWREAPPALLAALYADAGRPQRLDVPGEDPLVQVDGAPLLQAFRATFPPDIFVLDQPLIDGEIVVERVVSDGPGWIVAHFDDDGELGLIIGFAPLEDGVNELVRIPLVETAVTEQLYLMLHVDDPPLGEFDFPGGDQQVRSGAFVMNPVPLRLAPGNSLFTADQPLAAEADGTASVTIPLIITDIDAWVVIRADVDGELGEIIGQTWLPAGISRDVRVPVDAAAVTPTLHAILHHDNDSDQEFDFPDGLDQPLQRNRRLIQAPFTLLTP